MYKTAITFALLASASPAFAEEITLKPLVDARLRYESVDQVPFAADASAVTARVRAGIEAKTGVFAFLIEAEGTLAIVEDYNSGVNGFGGFSGRCRPAKCRTQPRANPVYRPAQNCCHRWSPAHQSG